MATVCGIAGTAGAPPDTGLLERMAETMANRGPDGQGIWCDKTAGLAARRLAIIDLHERSNQPMHLGGLHLVFNGEIYNYRELREELQTLGHSFTTEGDAEVLLHAWAEWNERALDRFNGMFAFALWDDSARELILASDPFGEKPLYYAEPEAQIVFASEIKAILHHPSVEATADEEAVGAYLARGVMPPPSRSFMRGIRRLPGAHVLRWQKGRVETRRYWRPRRVGVPGDYVEATRGLRELLLDSIRLRLRSDVPVGTSLSGGIDSSNVVLLSAELAGDHRRHAFTARFPGFERDEWRYANDVALKAGVVEHHAVEPTAAGLLEDLTRLVVDHEEPVKSLSVYAQWRVMAAAKEAGIVVLLDGQGGDELFGGYRIAAGFALRAAGPRALLRELASTPSRVGVVAESFAMDVLPPSARRVIWKRLATPYAAGKLLTRSPLGPAPPEEWIQAEEPLGRELRTEAFATSLPELLRYADRSSMAHSRELRLPFLDRRIAEFAFSLPAEFLYQNGTSKRILRDVARDVIPASVRERRDKVGYEPPQRLWLDDPAVRRRTAEILLDPVARRRGFYDTDVIERDAKSAGWRDPDGIWRALNTELWLREVVSRNGG